MPKKEIVSTTVAHIEELAKTMRKCDADEVWASGHMTPLEALQRGVALSEESFTGLMDGKVVCIFGVSTVTPFSRDGVPWLLASDLINETQHTFLRVNRVYVNEIKKRYASLENYVDCRNIKAIKWLKWLGFELDEPAPYGPDNMLFRRFSYRR
jgi:nitrogenase molybdenum-iron protein alpha/beta subunit